MTTHRHIVFLFLITLGLLAPESGSAKSCRSVCGQEIASCQSTCAVGGRGARHRCRNACKRGLVIACRQYDGVECLAPVPTETTLGPTTTSTRTATGAPTTSTTSEPPAA